MKRVVLWLAALLAVCMTACDEKPAEAFPIDNTDMAEETKNTADKIVPVQGTSPLLDGLADDLYAETSFIYEDITFAVMNDTDNGKYHVEFCIPGVREDGTQLISGDTVWVALQINDLFTDPTEDPIRINNLASNGGHNIENFKEIVLP